MFILNKNIFFKNLLLKLLLYIKLPLISYCAPKILESTSEIVKVKIPLKRKTRNHLKSMYFGALCIGADFAGGMLTLNIIKKHNSKAKLIFKDFQAIFLKRAVSDVTFICKDCFNIEKNVLNNIKSKERVNFKIKVRAFDVSKTCIAEFELTTSIK